MFRESLLVTSAGSITQRSCATAMSFVLEMAGLAMLMVAPLFVQQAVPMLTTPPLPRTTSLTPDQIKEAVQLMTGSGDLNDDGKIHAPREISNVIVIQKDTTRRGRPTVDAECLNGGCVYDPKLLNTPVNDKKNIITNLFNTGDQGGGNRNVVLAQSKPIPISHMDPGMLITRIEPRYPDIARRARIQGVVVIGALIGKDGRMVSLNVVSGHPMLVPAALDAVRQWRYRPYVLNNQPVEVETRVEVNFTLQ